MHCAPHAHYAHHAPHTLCMPYANCGSCVHDVPQAPMHHASCAPHAHCAPLTVHIFAY